MNKQCALLPALSMLLLVACSSAPTRVYTLQPAAAARPPAPYSGPPLRILAVKFPAEFNRNEILTEQGNGELHIDDLDHWAAPLGKLAQQTLNADLMTRVPAGKVALAEAPNMSALIELQVVMVRMPAAQDVQLVANWQLALDSKASRSGVVRLPGRSAGSAAAVAHDISVLLSDVADQVAAALPMIASE